MKITQKDIDKIIISAYKTENGNIWINGILGGGIEWTDAGASINKTVNKKTNKKT